MVDEQHSGQLPHQDSTHEEEKRTETVAHTDTPPIDQRKILSIIAYIGPLAIVSYILSNNDKHVVFHAKQGLVLFVIEVVIWVLGVIFWPIWMIFKIIELIVFILSIIGIVNAASEKQKELPITGKFAKHF